MTSDPKNISLAAIYLFFIVMGPGVASPVYKLAFLASGTVEINEGVKRIDKIFGEKNYVNQLFLKYLRRMILNSEM